MTNLIYTIRPHEHSESYLKKLLLDHREIKFVSLAGIDLSAHETDEKIPMNLFVDNLSDFLNGSVQTDGSSVSLPLIATLNDAKIDLVPDLNVNWFVDYNFDNIDPITNKPVGTLKIPCFLKHNEHFVDSRSILKSSIAELRSTLLDTIKNNDDILNYYSLSADDIVDIDVSAATELEFWVKTPNKEADIDQLSTSQVLKEQYWQKTRGIVRTALEQTMDMLEAYEFEPEMGHKEVGGVKAALTSSGTHTHIMEQLEIDWKYDSAMQSADNEIFIRSLVKDTFSRNGLDVTFVAKPIDNVAGNGKHLHFSIMLCLADGRKLNIFTSKKGGFISPVGYGAVMGVLQNYEVINPFVTSSYNALKRLKPGFEAPVSTVTSLGVSPVFPSRNRTILVGLVKDNANPMATRFELRAPNPHTNVFLALGALNMAMVDGIKYVFENNLTEEDLLKEISKKPGEFFGYLAKDRAFRTEDNIFEDYTQKEREELFGKSPQTVFECVEPLNKSSKVSVFTSNDIIRKEIIESYVCARMSKWTTELEHRIIPNYVGEIRNIVKLHDSEDICCAIDDKRWDDIYALKVKLMKDTDKSESLFSALCSAIEKGNYAGVSKLQLEIDSAMIELRSLYTKYKSNIISL